jgi:hypothetical protein
MSKLTENWESYSRPHDDFMREGLDLEDFLLKSKLNFHNGNLTFKSKSKFNFTQKGAQAAHELSVKGKVGNNSTVEVVNKNSGETNVEANLDFGERDNFTLGAFGNFKLNQNDSQKQADTKFHLRAHYKDTGLLSFGLENWDPINGQPNLLSAGTSYGHLTPEFNAVLNTYFVFNIQSRMLSSVRLFLAGKKDKFNGRLEARVTRTLPEVTNTTTTNVTEPIKVNQDVDVKLSFSNDYDSKTRYGGDISYTLLDKITKANIAVRHKMDRVRLNGKLSSDKTLTCGISSVHDDLTISFAARSTLNNVVEKVLDKEVSRYWVGYKFGLALECNRI